MSSCPLLIMMALTSFLMFPGGGPEASQADSVSTLLQKDEVDKAETLLNSQPPTAEAIAFRGEIAFRRGNFQDAEKQYREALQLDRKTARARFGLGKLALTRLAAKDAVAEFKAAIELDPKEAVFHLYLAEGNAVLKNFAAQKAALQEYLKLAASEDPDRVAEAKAAIETIDALGTVNLGTTLAPENPKPIPFVTTLNLIFAQVMIDGKGPYRFVVDTGATQVVITEKLAATLGLKAITTTVMHGVGGGGKIESKLYKVNELGIGDVRVTNLPVGTFNDPLVSQLADGILGTSVLSDFVLSVDYASTACGRRVPARTILLQPFACADRGEREIQRQLRRRYRRRHHRAVPFDGG
jgi:hypothetical protein